MTYEERVKRLQTIAASLDSGRQSLTEALDLFEEAVTHEAEAMLQLQGMQKRAQDLIARADGAFELPDEDTPDGRNSI